MIAVEADSMVEFSITGDELWARMERAVEKVNERLRKTVRILEKAKVPYAVIGGHAVRAWVAQVDEAAQRTTQDVDILVRPGDFRALADAMTAAGFHHRNTSGLDMFVEHPDASARDAVHVLLVGNVERGGEPNPDIEPAARANDFQTVALETLVRMKLNAFRDKDRVHLRDMISLGMIDESWLSRYPKPLRERLLQLLNDPDG
jgi:thiamine pyrophosphate-dependent acetolactate synthase large subunit-like protein